MAIDPSAEINLKTRQETRYLGAKGQWYESALLAMQSLVKEALTQLLEDEKGSRMFSYEAAAVIVLRPNLVMKWLEQLVRLEKTEPRVLP